MAQKMLIGPFVHVNLSRSDYLIESAKVARQDGGNTFMLYSPIISARHDFHAPVDLIKFHRHCERVGIEWNSLVLHAPFSVNLANPIDERIWHFSLHFIRQQLIYCDHIGFPYLVLHPGSHLSATLQQGLDRLIRGLNRLNLRQYQAHIVLETMSGKGHELGARFQDFAYILGKLECPEKVGICLDTCHLNDAGYDLAQWDQVKKEMKKSFSLDKVWVVHLNDSQSPRNSHKDHHENIGYGTIGFENLVRIAQDEELNHATKILETPYYHTDHSPYKAEIKSLVKGRFVDFKRV